MTGLEPATSGVTGRRSNQLSYIPVALTLYRPAAIIKGSQKFSSTPYSLSIVVGSKFCKNPLNDSLNGTNNELTT